METALRLKPEWMAGSVPAGGQDSTGRLVFERLVEEKQPTANLTATWQLRIVEHDRLNAYVSADGAGYVESGLARLAGANAELWAAILSHQIGHVLGRDWARRCRHMARAGYHRDFFPALHHRLHAHASGARNASSCAMHPCWEERDRELAGA